MKNLLWLYTLASLTAAQTFTSFPQPRQLFARDAYDSASITISGSVTAAGLASASVKTYRNGVLIRTLTQPLAYSAGTAPFSFSPKIHAELASYKFEFYTDAVLAKTADSVLCGDAFLVDGQSNAANSDLYDYPNVSKYVPWLRTFSLSDTAWHGTIASAWGIGSQIILLDSIPACLINGAVPGTVISQHQRDTTFGSIYGNILFRINRAGLANGIRAVIWYQGEYETGDSLYNAVGYANSFKTLHDSWLSDFPGIKHFYMFQVRPGCGNGPLQDVLRDCMRRLPESMPDVSLMSTTNSSGHDGCHYSMAGYAEIGTWMHRLLARDIYGSSDTVNITAPNIQKAWYSDNARTRLVLKFDQPVLPPSDTTLKRYFSLNNEWAIADSISADTAQHTVTLYLKNGKGEGTAISYTPAMNDPFTGTTYEGPWLSNTRGIGPLTFCNVPIENKDPLDTLTPLSVQAIAADSLLEQYALTRVSAVVSYSNGVKDTTVKECVFTSLNPAVATVSAFGQVAGKSLGTVLIKVSKRGILDTVSIRVVASTATLDSIRLSKKTMNVAFLRDSTSATGYYHKGSYSYSLCLDTVAVWTSSVPAAATVLKGVVSRGSGYSLTPVTVTASLAGKSDTCWVSAPWLVTRSEMSIAVPNTYASYFSAAYVFDDARGAWVGQGLPSTLTITFANPQKIDKLFYLPMQDDRHLGTITRFTLLTGLDTLSFDTVGTINWSLDLKQKETAFTPRTVKYVRMLVQAAGNGYINADEIGFQRTDSLATKNTGNVNETLESTLTPYPSPFNPVLQIHYSLASSAQAKISVYSLDGRKIRTLVTGAVSKGHHTINWDGKNQMQQSVSSGMYLLVMESLSCRIERKITFLK